MNDRLELRRCVICGTDISFLGLHRKTCSDICGKSLFRERRRRHERNRKRDRNREPKRNSAYYLARKAERQDERIQARMARSRDIPLIKEQILRLLGNAKGCSLKQWQLTKKLVNNHFHIESRMAALCQLEAEGKIAKSVGNLLEGQPYTLWRLVGMNRAMDLRRFYDALTKSERAALRHFMKGLKDI
jgi:predicted nucleic acid-binding Zn ribbon protein